MLITVYISQPDCPPNSMENVNRAIEIMDRLRKMASEAKVTFVQHYRPRPGHTLLERDNALDDLSEGILAMRGADFVIFDKGWKNDKRCLVEDEAVVRYGKPYCRVDDLEDFFRRYITTAFNFDETPAEADTDI